MLRLIRYFVVASALVNVLTAHTAAQDSWRAVTDREGGFTIRFPGAPKYQQLPDRRYGFTSESYSFFYQGHDLRISFVPLNPPPQTPQEAITVLNDSSASYVTGFGKLLKQEKLTDGGRQYDNVYSEEGMLIQARTRLYVRHGHLYTLSCTTDASTGIDEQLVAQFFTSFRFLEDLPQRRVTLPRRTTKRGTRSIEQHGWYVQRGPDDDFSVAFPSKPDYKLSTNADAGIALHQYRCFFGENHFIVSYRDNVEKETVLEQLAQESIQSLLVSYPALRVTRQAQLNDGGYEIEMRGMMAGEFVYMETRLYMRNQRVYFISSTTWHPSELSMADVTKFFASFRLL